MTMQQRGMPLVTTTFEIPGHKTKQLIGMVRGVTVRSRNMFGQIGAGFQTLFGGNITLYTELCEHARQEAYEIMVRHAQEVGANAILGTRYDANEIAGGVTEVLCYGTAAIVEPTG